MSLSLDQVRRIAELARIELAPGEAERSREQLNGIFGLIEADAGGGYRRRRADGPRPRPRPAPARGPRQRDRPPRRLPEIAPEAEAGLYLVPKVIE
jgi:aspartyl-tRNA(Asn)/glutamyl-tRNA(Gln) amidotransferase subunit C